jgi:hypothetical protein
MKRNTGRVVLLGVVALLVFGAMPHAAAQGKFRLAWHDSRTGTTQHDKHWTNDIGSVVIRTFEMNLDPKQSNWSWPEQQRKILGIFPWFPTKHVESDINPEKISGRLR